MRYGTVCRPAAGLLLSTIRPTVADAFGWIGTKDAFGWNGQNDAFSGWTARPTGKSNCNEPDTGSSDVLSSLSVTIRRSRAETLTTAGVAFTVIGTSGRCSSERFSSTVGGALPRKRSPSLVIALAA